MPAAADYFTKTYQRLTTTLASDKAVSASSMSLSSATNWPTDTGIKVSVYDTETVNGKEEIDVDTYCVYEGTVSGSTITNLAILEGSDQLHTAGMKVSLIFTASHWNDLITGITTSLDQDGTLKAGAVDVAGVLASDVVTTDKILDDAVTAAKVDWASTGANGGIWWEELGRTTLGSAGDTISVTPITAKKYLRVIYTGINTGQIRAIIRFNNDSGNNYAWRSSVNGAADTQVASTSGLEVTDAQSQDNYAVIEVINVAAEEKQVISLANRNLPGAATAPGRVEAVGKWANTANQITRVDIVNTGTGDFATGSEVVVLGHD